MYVILILIGLNRRNVFVYGIPDWGRGQERGCQRLIRKGKARHTHSMLSSMWYLRDVIMD